jgi:hypothetical protein
LHMDAVGPEIDVALDRQIPLLRGGLARDAAQWEWELWLNRRWRVSSGAFSTRSITG